MSGNACKLLQDGVSFAVGRSEAGAKKISANQLDFVSYRGNLWSMRIVGSQTADGKNRLSPKTKSSRPADTPPRCAVCGGPGKDGSGCEHCPKVKQ